MHLNHRHQMHLGVNGLLHTGRVRWCYFFALRFKQWYHHMIIMTVIMEMMSVIMMMINVMVILVLVGDTFCSALISRLSPLCMPRPHWRCRHFLF